MEWWGWVLLVVAVVGAVFAFFEWRSWNKPLASGLESGPRGMNINVDGGTKPDYGRRNDLDKPAE